MEGALLMGIDSFVTVATTLMLPGMLGSGWDCRPLGLPRGEGKDGLVGLVVNINLEGLANMRANFGIEEPVLIADRPRQRAAA